MQEEPADKQLLTQTLERLRKLEEVVQQLQRKLEMAELKQAETVQVIEGVRREPMTLNSQAIKEIDLMNLPDSLRRTMMVMVKIGEATPEEVAEETRRTRGLENIYLNQLERLSYIEKFKRGKRVYFRSLRLGT